MEADERDRQKEREELEEIRKKLLEDGHPDPEAEMERVIWFFLHVITGFPLFRNTWISPGIQRQPGEKSWDLPCRAKFVL